MKRALYIAFIFCILPVLPVAAQKDDPTSIENYRLIDEGEPLPTTESLSEARTLALKAVNADNCEEALPLLQEWARQANILANITRQTVEPFYRASRDDQRSFVSRNKSTFEELHATESRSNGFIRDRHGAWVAEAECLHRLDRPNAALTAAYRALAYISHTESKSWQKMRDLVWEITGTGP